MTERMENGWGIRQLLVSAMKNMNGLNETNWSRYWNEEVVCEGESGIRKGHTSATVGVSVKQSPPLPRHTEQLASQLAAKRNEQYA
jgi:hypothetical protein